MSEFAKNAKPYQPTNVVGLSKQGMRGSVAWLGRYVAFHEIGPYAFVEYHPRKVDGARVTKEIDFESVMFSGFIDGKAMNESFHTLDSALAGAIAYRLEGPNHRADRYFIRSLA